MITVAHFDFVSSAVAESLSIISLMILVNQDHGGGEGFSATFF